MAFLVRYQKKDIYLAYRYKKRSQKLIDLCFFLQNTIETFTTRKETLSLKSKRYEHLWPVKILKRVKQNN